MSARRDKTVRRHMRARGSLTPVSGTHESSSRRSLASADKPFVLPPGCPARLACFRSGPSYGPAVEGVQARYARLGARPSATVGLCGDWLTLAHDAALNGGRLHIPLISGS